MTLTSWLEYCEFTKTGGRPPAPRSVLLRTKAVLVRDVREDARAGLVLEPTRGHLVVPVLYDADDCEFHTRSVFPGEDCAEFWFFVGDQYSSFAPLWIL